MDENPPASPGTFNAPLAPRLPPLPPPGTPDLLDAARGFLAHIQRDGSGELYVLLGNWSRLVLGGPLADSIRNLEARANEAAEARAT